MTKIAGKVDLHARRAGRQDANGEDGGPPKITGTFRRERRGPFVRLKEAAPPAQEFARENEAAAVPVTTPTARPARVAIMLALGHKLQRLLDEGRVGSMAEIAEMLGVTRARVAQIMNLTLLAPDVEEKILSLESVDGREPIAERDARGVLRAAEWATQRRKWVARARW